MIYTFLCDQCSFSVVTYGNKITECPECSLDNAITSDSSKHKVKKVKLDRPADRKRLKAEKNKSKMKRAFKENEKRNLSRSDF